MKRPIFIISAAAVCVIALIVYFAVRTPPGVEPKGDASVTVAWLALATAIVSLIATITGLVQKIIELRHTSISKD